MIKFLRNFTNKNLYFSILLSHFATMICTVILFYYLIPILLNYPPNSINTPFQLKVNVTYYSIYYSIISLCGIILELGYMILCLKPIKMWEKGILKKSEDIIKLRKLALVFPLRLFNIFVFVPFLLIILLLIILNTDVNLTIKIALIMSVFLTLPSIITYITTKKLFKVVLIKTYSSKNEKFDERTKSSIFKLIILQTAPIIVVGLVFMLLIGISLSTKELGNKLFELNMLKLENKLKKIENLNNIEAVKDYMLRDLNKTIFFCISPNDKIYTSDNSKLSNFWIKYIYEFSKNNNGRVYDDFGYDFQGVVKYININNELWIVGYKYEVLTRSSIFLFVCSMLIILGINMSVLVYFANSITIEIKNIVKGLDEIGNTKSINNKMPIVSNDELGDLVIAYNKIQDLTQRNLETIQSNQQVLMEKERLASLGQLIGGIAHNLKTPIMGISGAAEGLRDLIKEYDSSIEDKSVTYEDHHEIANDMSVWIEKIKLQCSYMSDIITAVKGQAVQMNANMYSSFTIDELIKRVDILMKHELKRAMIEFKTNILVNTQTILKGDLNNLIQVINNLIQNSIEAYEESKGGIIEFRVFESNGNIVFVIKDYGKGISEAVQSKIFKEMVTTKGNKGTGIGLYMSYSTIVGKFNGKMTLDSKENYGTTFTLEIPI